MAVYKVIQDIESEDKLLGPLTLKSFIYAAIAGVLAFICIRLSIAGAPIYIKLVIDLILLFPIILFGTLASPLGRDQPTEVWLLSHVRFMLKPHLRTWSQGESGQLVTITAPKKEDLHLTKDFTQTEVQSRLQALATTLDSRGWAVKDAAVNIGGKAGYLDQSRDGDSDRLVGASSLPQSVPVIDVHAADDIMDEKNNATAHKFNEMVKEADNQRKQAVKNKMETARKAAQKVEAEMPKIPTSQDTSFLDKAPLKPNDRTVFVGKQIIAPGSKSGVLPKNVPLPSDAKALLSEWHQREEEIRRRSAGFKPKNEKPINKPLQNMVTQRQAEAEKQRQATVTATQTAAKLELAQSGNDLSVASIAQLANRNNPIQQIGPGEVVISLH